MLNEERITALLRAPPFCPGVVPSRKRTASEAGVTRARTGGGSDSDHGVVQFSSDEENGGDDILAGIPIRQHATDSQKGRRKPRIEFTKKDEEMLAKWLSKRSRKERDLPIVFKEYVAEVRHKGLYWLYRTRQLTSCTHRVRAKFSNCQFVDTLGDRGGTRRLICAGAQTGFCSQILHAPRQSGADRSTRRGVQTTMEGSRRAEAVEGGVQTSTGQKRCGGGPRSCRPD
jgi:hypothetical protein